MREVGSSTSRAAVLIALVIALEAVLLVPFAPSSTIVLVLYAVVSLPFQLILLALFVIGVPRKLRDDCSIELNELAMSARQKGFVVTVVRGAVRLRLNWAVRASVRRSGGMVKVKALPTPYGTLWLVFSILFPLPPFTIAGIALVLYMELATARFIRRDLREVALESRIPEGSTRALLIDGLSAARRHALDALDLRRSEYHDALILAWITGGAISAVAALAVAQVVLDVPPSWTSSIVAASALLTGVLIYLALRRSYAPRLNELEQWDDDLAQAIGRERRGENETSSLDLLMRVSSMVGPWLELRRRSVMNRHPVTAIAVLVLWLVGLSGILGSFMLRFQNGMTVVTVDELRLAVSIVPTAVGTLLYARIRRLESKERAGEAREWSERYDRLMERMDRLLEDI